MRAFDYTAIDRQGNRVSGRIEAEVRGGALATLKARALIPVGLQEALANQPANDAERGNAENASDRGRRLSRVAVENFIRELANLLRAGVPLSRALHLIERQAAQPAARRQWREIHDEVVGGRPLAEAMGRWPRTFSPVCLAMVRAGETGGFLDVVLGQIADFQAREHELKGRVKAALVYPAVLAGMASLVMVFLLIYFIPRFTLIFADFDEALPWLTQVIVGFSNFLLGHYPWLIAGVGLLVFGGHRFLHSPAGRRKCETAVLRLPGLGTVTARFALVRFCRMLGTLLGAGVPLLASLRVAREAIGNASLSDAVEQAVDEVRRGEGLSASLARVDRLFPLSVVEMLAVAEESGGLSDELLHIANTYESDLDRRLRMLVSLAEPALLFVMAAIVGTVVIGMLLPVFSLQEMIN